MKDYIIYKPLGIGGEGFVYKARKKESKERFAIKLISPSKDGQKDFGEKLLREGRIIEQIGKHKNITELIEYGIEKDISFIVFRFIPGERLDNFVEKRKKLSEKKALSFLFQIIDAQIHILSQNFLYRDLKPENILVEKNHTIKLCDFGICIPIEEKASHSNVSDEFEGSPYYIPPERILGGQEGEFSEIYSLGMILYYMLTGTTYFTETQINELISRHIEPEAKTRISEKLASNNPKLPEIIEKMTQYNPSMRYQNFEELSRDLKELEEELMRKPTLYLQTRTKKINVSELRK